MKQLLTCNPFTTGACMTLFSVLLVAFFLLIGWLLCLEAIAEQSRICRVYIASIVIRPQTRRGACRCTSLVRKLTVLTVREGFMTSSTGYGP